MFKPAAQIAYTVHFGKDVTLGSSIKCISENL